jgi:hypothetical protein
VSTGVRRPASPPTAGSTVADRGDESGPDGELGAAIERALNDAIAGVFAQHEQSMVTKWVMLAETMDGAGERGLWPMTSDGVQAWDTVGMLSHALHLQQAQVFADMLGD